MGVAGPDPTPTPEDDASLEARLLHAVLAHTQEYVYVKDLEGRYQVASTSIARVLGLPGPEELLGKDDQEVLPPELAKRVAERDREILASGEALVDSELSG